MKVKNLFAIMFAATALIACNNEDESVSVGTGEKAWMSLSISLTNPETRAADNSDVNAEDVETAVDNIHVYLAGDGTTTGYEEIVGITKSSFTGPTAGSEKTIEWTSKQAVQVPGKAGDNTRNLFVVINQPDGFNAGDIDGGVYTGDITKLAVSGKFTMFNSKEVFAKLYAKQADAEADAGRTEVAVERLAAKALLTTTLDFSALVPDANKSGTTGNFAANSLKWRIRNSNTKMYHIKKNDYKSPNWDYEDGVTKFTDYTLYPWATALIDVPAQVDAPATGYKDGKALVQYFTENTNQTYINGNTTQMAIQADFIPTAIATAYAAPAEEGKEPTWTMDNANTTLQTFYYAVAEKKYMTETAKTAFATENPDAKIWGPYTNGKCLYYVAIGTSPLTVDANLGAKRNHYYKANVKSLVAPGMPGEPDDTEKVNKDDVWIAVDLTIEPWSLVSMGELELK